MLNIHFRWWVQLFWAAFDMPIIVVPLKVALRLEKIDFWAFQKNNHASGCQVNVHDYFLKRPKTIFLYPNASFNGTPVMGISKAAQTIEPTHLK